MTTRCKYTCISVRKYKHWDITKEFLFEAEFTCVTSGSEENKSFFEATPQGSMKVSTYVEDRFQPGQEYFIDIVGVA